MPEVASNAIITLHSGERFIAETWSAFDDSPYIGASGHWDTGDTNLIGVEEIHMVFPSTSVNYMRVFEAAR